jgi:hypothetical protein
MRLPFRILAGVVLVLFAFAALLPDSEEPADLPPVQETVDAPAPAAADETVPVPAASEVPVEQPVTETWSYPGPDGRVVVIPNDGRRMWVGGRPGPIAEIDDYVTTGDCRSVVGERDFWVSMFGASGSGEYVYAYAQYAADRAAEMGCG